MYVSVPPVRIRVPLARLRVAGPASAIAFLLVMAVLSGCSVFATSTGPGPTTTGAGSTTTTVAPPATTATTVGTLPPSTSAPASEVTINWLGISFALPNGWVVDTPIQGSPQDGCIHPATPSPASPRWFGCSGVWVMPLASDPATPAPGYLSPGQAWFLSSGVVPCPYPSSHPDDVVLGPGTLVGQGSRSVGGVRYRWYEWSATCNLNGTLGAPVTHTFDTQIWWLPSAGVAFTDVAGHPGVDGILGSVGGNTGSESTTTTGPTSTTNPIKKPTGVIEFRSPSANIHCEISYGRPASSRSVYCYTAVPPESATMRTNGKYTTCVGTTCLANPGLGEVELAYGRSVSKGPFRCSSTTSEIVCTSKGKGFTISRSGILPT